MTKRHPNHVHEGSSHEPCRRAAPRVAGRNFLFVPGPTNVPDRVLRAMMVTMEDHRSPTFPELTAQLRAGLSALFKSRSAQIVMFPSSGTGAWEAALTNTLSTGDTVPAPRFGHFSHLWIEMARHPTYRSAGELLARAAAHR